MWLRLGLERASGGSRGFAGLAMTVTLARRLLGSRKKTSPMGSPRNRDQYIPQAKRSSQRSNELQQQDPNPTVITYTAVISASSPM